MCCIINCQKIKICVSLLLLGLCCILGKCLKWNAAVCRPIGLLKEEVNCVNNLNSNCYLIQHDITTVVAVVAICLISSITVNINQLLTFFSKMELTLA